MSIAIRLATADDLPRINEIYNHYVRHSTCTYQEELETPEARAAWFAHYGPEHPVTVAVIDGLIVGWGSISKYHPRSAYRFAVENSVYVAHDWQRQGIGGALLADLIERAKGNQFQTIIAIIDADQAASVAIHSKFGFEKVAYLKHVGFKFGRWLDVIYMQLML